MIKNTEYLQALPFFSGLNPKELAQIGHIAAKIELKKGQTLFSQGDPVRGVFFLFSGQLKIYKLSPSGKAHILHIIKPGQSFAEGALFMESGYPAFCEALDKSSVICLPKREFLDLLTSNPLLSISIIASMSQYLRRFADQIEDLSLKDVSTRLARWLIATSNEVGRDFWDLSITKGQLANQLGTVSETLSRTLRKFQDAGCLEVRGKFFKILDRECLEKFAQSEETDED